MVSRFKNMLKIFNKEKVSHLVAEKTFPVRKNSFILEKRPNSRKKTSSLKALRLKTKKKNDLLKEKASCKEKLAS